MGSKRRRGRSERSQLKMQIKTMTKRNGKEERVVFHLLLSSDQSFRLYGGRNISNSSNDNINNISLPLNP